VYTEVTVLYNSMGETASDQDGADGGAHEEGFEEAPLRTASLQDSAAGDGPVQVTRMRIVFGEDEGEDQMTHEVVAPIPGLVQQRRQNEQGGAGRTGKRGGVARSQVSAAGHRSSPESMGVGSGSNVSESERTSSTSSGEGGRKRLSQSPTRSHVSLCVCDNHTHVKIHTCTYTHRSDGAAKRSKSPVIRTLDPVRGVVLSSRSRLEGSTTMDPSTSILNSQLSGARARPAFSLV